jgi:hypothetical protein
MQVFATEQINAELIDITTPYPNDTTGLGNFFIKNETEFYFTDTANNKVVVWKESVVEEFGSAGGLAENFAAPSLITVLPNGDIYVHEGRRLKHFNSNYEFQDNLNMVYSNGNYIFMGHLSSIASDLKNNLYALDYEKNIVIKKSSDTNELIELINGDNLDFTINNNSQIALSPNGETIFLTNINGGNNIYYINNLQSLNQVDITTHSITTVDQIAIDCANNLFVLEKNAVNSKIHKLSRNTYDYESYLNITANELNDISRFNINIETGQIVLNNSATNTLQTLNLLGYTGSFTEDIYSFVHPVTYTDEQYLQTAVAVATVEVENTPLLQTPYNVTPLLNLAQTTKLIILSTTVEANPDYYYVLFVNSANKVNISGYVLAQNLQVLNNSTFTPYNVNVLNNATKLYKYPTSLNSLLNSPVTVGEVDKNQELNVLANAYNITDANEQQFLTVEINENQIAYVRVIDVVPTNLNLIVPTLFTNAEIIITDDASFVNVYAYPNSPATLMPDTLTAGERIYIQSYDTEKTWTQITFLNEQNEEIEGYIQTKYIKVHSDYNNLLQAFILILISFVLIVVLLLVKTNK